MHPLGMGLVTAVPLMSSSPLLLFIAHAFLLAEVDVEWNALQMHNDSN